MAAKRKYSVYVSLFKALQRDKILETGATATLLLDTFILRRGELKAATAIERGLCTDAQGSFSAWRQPLIDKGWLVYDRDCAQRTKRYTDHEPGHKLYEFLNKERIKREEMASVQDVENLRRETLEQTHALSDRTTELAREKADVAEVGKLRSKVDHLETEMEQMKAQLSLMAAQFAEHYVNYIFPPDTEARREKAKHVFLQGKFVLPEDEGRKPRQAKVFQIPRKKS